MHVWLGQNIWHFMRQDGRQDDDTHRQHMACADKTRQITGPVPQPTPCLTYLQLASLPGKIGMCGLVLGRPMVTVVACGVTCCMLMLHHRPPHAFTPSPFSFKQMQNRTVSLLACLWPFCRVQALPSPHGITHALPVYSHHKTGPHSV